MATLQIFLTLAYPALIYLALGVVEPRIVAIGALVLLAARVGVSGPSRLLGYAREALIPGLAVAAALLASAAWNSPIALLATPAVVSLALFASFARTFWQDQTLVERLALLRADQLSEAERSYCRRVTLLWCGFFLANSAAALWLAMFGNRELWVLYTGLVSYLLIGTVYALEFSYRQWRFRRYLGAPTDALFQRIFPPRSPSSPTQ